MERLPECTGFEWDEADEDKNWLRHRVTRGECEQAFFNRPCVAAEDTGHSTRELRFYALGQTDEGRELFVAFTMRDRYLRVVSARDNDAGAREFSEFVG